MKLGRLVQHWWIKLFGKFQVWSASHTRQPALAASSPLPSPSLTVSPHWPSRAGLVAHPRRRGSWVLTILSSTGAALLGWQHLPLAHAPSSVVLFDKLEIGTPAEITVIQSYSQTFIRNQMNRSARQLVHGQQQYISSSIFLRKKNWRIRRE